MEERQETEQEYIDNTQLLLNEIDINLDRTDEIFDMIRKAIGECSLYESYLTLTYICKYIENFLEMDEKDKQWFDFVANRCLVLKKKDEITNSFEGIN